MIVVILVAGAEGSYIKPLEVMSYSFLSNNEGTHQIYVMSNSPPASFERLHAICRYFSSNLIIVKPRALNAKIKDMLGKIHGIATDAMYYRIYMAEILPKEIDKVLYLDCDLIVRKQLDDLWNLDISDFFLAASTFHGSMKRLEFVEKFGGAYFNSGVMMVNLKMWRDHHVSAQCEEILTVRASDIRFHDQCLLNFACRPWKLIEANWNFNYAVGRKWSKHFGMTLDQFDIISRDPSIVHYIGSQKPWVKPRSDVHLLEEEYFFYRERLAADLAEASE